MDSDKHRPICTRPGANGRRMWPLPGRLVGSSRRADDDTAQPSDERRPGRKHGAYIAAAWPKIMAYPEIDSRQAAERRYRSTPEVPAAISVVSVWRHVYGHVVSASTSLLARFINKRNDAVTVSATGRMSNSAPCSGINDVIPPTGRPLVAAARVEMQSRIDFVRDESPPWPRAPSPRWVLPRRQPTYLVGSRSFSRGRLPGQRTSRRRWGAVVATGWLKTVALCPLHGVAWAISLQPSFCCSREADITQLRGRERTEQRGESPRRDAFY